MSLVVQEWEARIALIRSIAHSQEAMARILGSIADVAEHSPHLAKSIRDNIQSLNALQLSMAETVTGVRLKRTRLGRPAQPLLRQGVYAPEGS